MPDCWIFLLKRRRALSNVSFSPTRTSANPGFTSSGMICNASRLVAPRCRRDPDEANLPEPPECSPRLLRCHSAGGYAAARMETLLDLLDEAVARFGDRPALGIRREDGSTDGWSYLELERRSRLAAWRL